MQTDGKSTSPYGIDIPGRETIPGRWLPNSATAIQGRSVRAAWSLRTGDFALIMAGLAALGGMTMGILMGISQDFTLSPAHAHLNLLGWVTLALYGLYHRSIDRVGGWLGWSQILAGVIGAYMMAGGLALYLGSGDDRYFPLIVAGSLVAFLGMVLFVAIVIIEVLSLTPASPRSRSPSI